VFSLIIKEKYFLESRTKFFLTEKYFLLANFFNNKQVNKNLKNNFQKSLIDRSHAKNNCLKIERVDRLTNVIVHEIWRCTLDMHI